MTTLVANLVAALNAETIEESLNMVRSRRPSILGSIKGFAAPEIMASDRKIQWLDYRIDARSDVTTASALVGATTITVADGTKFRSRMILRNDRTSELVVVSSVSGNDLTIQRAYGSTAVAINSGDTFYIESVAREENSLPDADAIDQPAKMYNLVQTMDFTIDMSDDSQKIRQWGDTNDLAMQVSNQMQQLTYQLNNALIGGVRGSFTVGSKPSYSAGGMRYFAAQSGGINVDNSAATLTLEQINAVYETIFNRGGNVSRIAVGTKLGRKLSALVKANYNSTRLDDWSNDAGSLISLPSDLPLFGGITNIVIDNTLGASELFMYDPDRIEIVPAAANQSDTSGGWQTMDATQPGQDGKAVRVIGKLTTRFRDSKTHLARVYNIG